ncbi:hypothetical protein OsI_15170 [Oryza sativa Indica Group]|uniref:Uncharacterized protein n=1 Tax=Oryza sativa subsp. indica TaxID=39946 RepID=A2XRB2_ORYSI|nr:hypothetical protein OsI_15170 [Oryza sativa Indica Group]
MENAAGGRRAQQTQVTEERQKKMKHKAAQEIADGSSTSDTVHGAADGVCFPCGTSTATAHLLQPKHSQPQHEVLREGHVGLGIWPCSATAHSSRGAPVKVKLSGHGYGLGEVPVILVQPTTGVWAELMEEREFGVEQEPIPPRNAIQLHTSLVFSTSLGRTYVKAVALVPLMSTTLGTPTKSMAILLIPCTHVTGLKYQSPKKLFLSFIITTLTRLANVVVLDHHGMTQFLPNLSTMAPNDSIIERSRNPELFALTPVIVSAWLWTRSDIQTLSDNSVGLVASTIKGRYVHMRNPKASTFLVMVSTGCIPSPSVTTSFKCDD